MSNSQQRTSLGLDDEPIDLEELTGTQQRPVITPEKQKEILKAGEKTGFVSRQPTRRRKVSPYTAQFGGRCREGMKGIFQEIGERMGLYDNQTLELAILALIEKEGYTDLKKKYEELVK